MFSGAVQLLWHLLQSGGFQPVLDYLARRVFIPPDIPVVDAMPGVGKVLPGAEAAFTAAVVGARNIYCFTGVGEGYVAGAISVVVLLMLARFWQGLKK